MRGWTEAQSVRGWTEAQAVRGWTEAQAGGAVMAEDAAGLCAGGVRLRRRAGMAQCCARALSGWRARLCLVGDGTRLRLVGDGARLRLVGNRAMLRLDGDGARLRLDGDTARLRTVRRRDMAAPGVGGYDEGARRPGGTGTGGCGDGATPRWDRASLCPGRADARRDCASPARQGLRGRPSARLAVKKTDRGLAPHSVASMAFASTRLAKCAVDASACSSSRLAPRLSPVLTSSWP